MKMRHILAAIIAVVIFFIGIAYAVPARAAQFEAGLGATNYELVPNGDWYQIGAQNNVTHTHSLSASFGVVQDFHASEPFGVRVHADYEYLGRASSFCDCVAGEAYNTNTHAIVPGSPTSSFAGAGYVQGLALTAEPYVDLYDWRLGYVYGEFYYRDTWSDHVISSTFDVTLSSPTGWHRGSVHGFSVSRGAWTVSYRTYGMPAWHGEDVPPLWTGARTMLVTYAF